MFTSPAVIAPNFTCIVKSADQDVTNNGTPQTDTELAFDTVTNGIYAVESFLIVSGNNATGDYLFRWNVSANTMDGSGTMISLTTADAIQTAVMIATAAAQTGNISVGTRADLTIPIAVRAWFTFKQNTGNATFRLQFCNAAAAAGRTSRTLAGSWLQYARLA